MKPGRGFGSVDPFDFAKLERRAHPLGNHKDGGAENYMRLALPNATLNPPVLILLVEDDTCIARKHPAQLARSWVTP